MKDMAAYAIGETVMDRADYEVERLDRAEDAITVARAFYESNTAAISRMRRRHWCVAHRRRRAPPPGERRVIAGAGEGGVADCQREVLGHLAAIEHGDRSEGDLGAAAQGPARARHDSGDGGEIVLGGGQQLGALAPPLSRQRRIAAHDEALAWVIGDRSRPYLGYRTGRAATVRSRPELRSPARAMTTASRGRRVSDQPRCALV